MRKKHESYWALVKFEVTSEHFSPTFSFKHYVSETKEAAARAVAEDFTAQVDQALQHEEVDNETIAERERLTRLLRPFLNKTPKRASGKMLRAMEASVDIGYSSHALGVLTEGEREVFLTTFPVSLEHDRDFQIFMGGANPEDLDDLDTKLLDHLKRIKETPIKELTDADVAVFFEALEETVYNDTM